MPLPRDPDILRVPAFMRKRNLRVRAKRPLVLTAFDRKQNVIAKEQKRLKQSQRLPRPQKRARNDKLTQTFSAPMLDFFAEPMPSSPPSPPKKSKSIPRPKTKSIGTLTHYYDKIKVGVIKLTGILSIGDCIEYKTDEGSYSQIVESMEINREPAFKAGRGKEVGLKLRKIPRAGSAVNMIK